jgi:hypothetical protein
VRTYRKQSEKLDKSEIDEEVDEGACVCHTNEERGNRAFGGKDQMAALQVDLAFFPTSVCSHSIKRFKTSKMAILSEVASDLKDE